jgi:hypothetical protein
MAIFGTGTSVLDGGPAVQVAFALSTQLTGGQLPGTSTSYSGTISIIPLPGALVLFGSGLVGLAALGRRRKQKLLEASLA